MEEEVAYSNSSHVSNPETPQTDRHNDEVGVVSSTSGYPLIPAFNPVNNPVSIRHQQKSKYSQLLAIIEELGKDIRPMYAGSRSSAERLKRGIIYARILVKECLMETDRNAKS